jgi:heterodisulfide reductase subunit B
MDTRYTYYPGCSLHATGIAYDKSMRAVFKKLGSELAELEDWNCCGATAYMSVQKTVAFAVSARNLALAEKTGDDVVAPCSACYYALKHTREGMAADPELRAQVEEALAAGGLEADLSVEVRHPLEVLLTDIGIPRLVEAQTNSLEQFRPACYYGCQIVRPFGAVDEDPELPMSMENLFTALGARPVDYPPKVRCCGGMLVATMPEVATELSMDLVDWAVAREANCIVTVCPLCQSNLDLINVTTGGNGASHQIPVLYFTQLIGLAIGCTPEEVGMQHALIPSDAHAPPLRGAPLTIAGSREG